MRIAELESAWRLRRALVVGGGAGARWTAALLTELGASVARISEDSGARALWHSMTQRRVAAVFCFQGDDGSGEGVPPRARPARLAPSARLARLEALTSEAREAGVPLLALCSDAPVYLRGGMSRAPREDDPLGGQTREGAVGALLMTYLDGVSRALYGDAVCALRVLHAPCLGGDSPAARQAERWCAALLGGEVVPVEHPSMRSAFVHPVEAACGTLQLAAACMALGQGGAFNLGVEPQCLLANRTAARRLVARAGGARPVRETEPPREEETPPPDGARAKAFCGAACRLPAEDALEMLYALRRAEREGPEAAEAVVREQAKAYLEGLERA